MRESFFKSFEEVMKEDERVVFLTSDTGFNVLDNIRRDYKTRCYNVGIAEQNMVGVAAGLAMSGKVVYVYAIVPFVTMRPWEQVRVDVCVQNLNVKLIGIGAGMDYCTLGPTHHGHEDIAVMRNLPNMTILSPCDRYSAAAFAHLSHKISGPVYVRLERYSAKEPVYGFRGMPNFSQGMNIIKDAGRQIVIIATGRIVLKALEVAQYLYKEHSIRTSVVDLFRIKPLNEELLLKTLKRAKVVATLEEHSIVGGLGSAIAEFLAEHKTKCSFRRFGLPDEFCREYGNRDFLHELCRLDVHNIAKGIMEIM